MQITSGTRDAEPLAARRDRCYAHSVASMKARVVNGRLVMNEPCDLPDGTELDLVVADDGDEMDETERAQLEDSIEKALAEAKAGKLIPADEVLRQLRSRR